MLEQCVQARAAFMRGRRVVGKRLVDGGAGGFVAKGVAEARTCCREQGIAARKHGWGERLQRVDVSKTLQEAGIESVYEGWVFPIGEGSPTFARQASST